MSEQMSLEAAIEAVLHHGPTFETIAGLCKMAVEASKKSADEPVACASAWFALVMNAAAELEDASHCLRDEDAKRTAISGAKHYRDAAKALYTRPQPADEPCCYHDGRNIVGREFSDHEDVFPLYTRPQPAAPEQKGTV